MAFYTVFASSCLKWLILSENTFPLDYLHHHHHHHQNVFIPPKRTLRAHFLCGGSCCVYVCVYHIPRMVHPSSNLTTTDALWDCLINKIKVLAWKSGFSCSLLCLENPVSSGIIGTSERATSDFTWVAISKLIRVCVVKLMKTFVFSTFNARNSINKTCSMQSAHMSSGESNKLARPDICQEFKSLKQKQLNLSINDDT